MNSIGHLPRYNSKGALTSNNFADYSFVNCSAETNSASWTFGPCVLGGDLRETNVEFVKGSQYGDTSLLNYITSFAFYIVVPVLIFFVTAVFFGCCCFFRYCWCCAKGGTCGKRVPSDRGSCCCSCGLGFRPLPVERDGKPVYVYSECGRWCARIMVLIYVALTIAAIFVGQFQGNQGLTQALKVVAQSPESLVETTRATLGPAQNVFVNLVGGVLVDGVHALNATIVEHAKPQDLLADLRCVTRVVDALPSSSYLYDIINFVNQSIEALPNQASTRQLLQDLNQTKHNLPVVIPQSTSMLTAFNTAKTTIMGETTSIAAQLQSLNETVMNLTAAIPVVLADLNGLENALPSTAHLADMVASVTDLASNGTTAAGSDYGVAYRTNIATQLQDLLAGVSSMPAPVPTANFLLGINSDLNAAQTGPLSTLGTTLSSLNQAVATLPSTATVTQLLNQLQGMMTSFNAPQLVTVIQDISMSLGFLPDTGYVIGNITLIYQINDTVPCMLDVAHIVLNVNQTLFELPDSAFTLTDALLDSPKTVADVLQQADDLIANLNTLSTDIGTVKDMDLDNYITQINNVESQIQGVPSLSTLMSDVSSMDTDRDINVASAISSIDSISSVVSDPSCRFTPAMDSSLRGLQPTYEDLPPSIQSALTALQKWEGGLCSGGGGQTCMAVCHYACAGFTGVPFVGPYEGFEWQSCPVGQSCDMTFAAVAVCKANPGTPCTNDGQCPSGDHCLVPSFDDLTAKLASFSSERVSVPDLSTLTSRIVSLQSDLDSAPNLMQQRARVLQLQNGLSSIPNLQPYQNALVSLGDQTGTMPDTDALIRDWDKVPAALDAFDLSSARSYVGKYDDMISQVRGDVMDNVNKCADRGEAWFFGSLGNSVNSISRASLDSIIATAGFSAAINHVLLVAQDICDNAMFVVDHAPVDLSLQTQDIIDGLNRLNIAENNSLLAQGPIFFVAKLLSYKNTPWSVSVISGSPGDLVWKDASGTHYPDQTYCLTSQCINDTITYINTQPLKNIDDKLQVGMSRETLTSLPFLIPGVIVLFALVGALSLGKQWQKWPTLCALFFLLIVMPWLFLFVGGFFFPGIMFAADVCTSSEDVARVIVSQRAQAICETGASGTYMPASGLCSVTVYDQPISFNIEAMVEDIFGACGSASDPVQGAYSSLELAVGKIPRIKVQDQLNEISGQGKPTELMENIILTIADNSSMALQSLVSDLSGVWNCANINKSYFQLKGAFCCHILSSFAWLIGAWYCIAWAMLCCGCCGGILGYKRFPKTAWGPFVQRLQAAQTSPAGVATMVAQPAMPQHHHRRRSSGSHAAPGVPVTAVAVVADGAVPPVVFQNYELTAIASRAVPPAPAPPAAPSAPVLQMSDVKMADGRAPTGAPMVVVVPMGAPAPYAVRPGEAAPGMQYM